MQHRPGRRVRALTEGTGPRPAKGRSWHVWGPALAAIVLVSAAASQLGVVHQILEPLVHL